jgi:hypothetical protein
MTVTSTQSPPLLPLCVDVRQTVSVSFTAAPTR